MKKEYTGERFLPDECQGEIAIEHYQRYRFASQFVKGKKILDAACGEGYGSRLLSEEAECVVGLDFDENVVERAKQKYQNERLTFLRGSVGALPFENHLFDAVISFETIEHVDAETQENFLKEIRRVLKKDGILIMSTPNKAVYTDLVKGENAFHVKEFYVDEYQDFLHRYFKKIELFSQYPDLGYFLSREGEPISICNKVGKTAIKSRYVIALCSDDIQKYEVDTTGLAVFDDGMYYELNRYAHERETQILALKSEAEAFELQLEANIREQETYIIRLEQDIRKQKEYIGELQQDIRKQKEYIDELQQDISEMEQNYLSLQEEHENLMMKWNHPLKYLTEKRKRK